MSEAEESDDRGAAVLEQASRVADAQLGVAEDFGWGIAVLGGLLCRVLSHSWLLAVACGVSAYWLVTLRYRRRAAAVEDAYYRAAKLGKYHSPRS